MEFQPIQLSKLSANSTETDEDLREISFRFGQRQEDDSNDESSEEDDSNSDAEAIPLVTPKNNKPITKAGTSKKPKAVPQNLLHGFTNEQIHPDLDTLQKWRSLLEETTTEASMLYPRFLFNVTN